MSPSCPSSGIPQQFAGAPRAFPWSWPNLKNNEAEVLWGSQLSCSLLSSTSHPPSPRCLWQGAPCTGTVLGAAGRAAAATPSPCSPCSLLFQGSCSWTTFPSRLYRRGWWGGEDGKGFSTLLPSPSRSFSVRGKKKNNKTPKHNNTQNPTNICTLLAHRVCWASRRRRAERGGSQKIRGSLLPPRSNSRDTLKQKKAEAVKSWGRKEVALSFEILIKTVEEGWYFVLLCTRMNKIVASHSRYTTYTTIFLSQTEAHACLA